MTPRNAVSKGWTRGFPPRQTRQALRAYLRNGDDGSSRLRIKDGRTTFFRRIAHSASRFARSEDGDWFEEFVDIASKRRFTKRMATLPVRVRVRPSLSAALSDSIRFDRTASQVSRRYS